MNKFRKHLLEKGSSIRKALERLDMLGKDAILFIVDSKQKLVGSLTDGDIRRGLLSGHVIENTIDEIIQDNPRYLRKGESNIKKVIEYRENNFRIIPILDKHNHVINIINFREIKSYLPVDSIIMAGGRGERLKPLTDSVPKPLLKVGEKPILEHNIDRLRLFGIDDIWISVRYLGKQIERYFGNGKDINCIIQYVYEEDPLGTIGSLSKIETFLHDYILVTNSDILSNIDYEHFFLDFINRDADLSIATIPYHVSIPYAVLEANNGNVSSFKEKPTYTYYSNGGIYLLKKEVINLIPKNKLYNATDLIEKLILMERKVVTYPLVGYWLDIGKHDDYVQAQKDINNINFK